MTQNNIDKQIQRLLARYGVARVPGLGIFSLQHRDAHFRGNLLLPPGDTVLFTPDTLCRDDNSLAEQIMRDRKITFPEAKSILAQATTTIDPQSLTGWQTYLPQNLGLHPLPANQILRTSPLAGIAKYAAVVALALTLNLTFPYNTVPDDMHSEASLLPLVNVETLSHPQQDVIDEPQIETEPKLYCVIISSLASQQDAINWTIAHNLCDSAEILKSDGHYRISRARFSSYAEAEQYITQNHLKAWVFKTTDNKD